MHIGLLTNFFPPDSEHGIPRYVAELAYALGKRSHNVEVISGSLDKNYNMEFYDGFKVHWIYNNIKSARFFPVLELLKFSFRIRKLLYSLHQQSTFDIIEYPNLTFPGFSAVFMGLSDPTPAFVVRLSSPSRNIPISGITPWRLTELFERYQTKHSNAYIGNTYENLEICEHVYGLNKTLPHCVILHGLPKGAIPELIYNQVPKNLVFFIGRIEPRKGFDILVKAWESIIKEIPNAKLIVAGEDHPWKEGKSFYNWSMSQINQETRSKIDYLGFVDSNRKELLYRECDIFVMPSRYESFGLVFLEAMRYGKPIVSCKVGGIPEVVSDRKTGLLVRPDNANELAKAIIALLKNDTLRYQMGIAAIQELNSKFTQDRVAEQTELFYETILKNHQPR